MTWSNLICKLCRKWRGHKTVNLKVIRPVITRCISNGLASIQGLSQDQLSLSETAKLRSGWQPVIGLEVHAQIKSNSKLFSGAETKFNSPANTQVSLFDAAIPGTLPVLNRRCVEAGVLTALALSCKVSPVSLFDRKHYFYSDLPAGFQITQQFQPLAKDGELEFIVFNAAIHKQPYYRKVHIKQLHLEQDSGKSLHDQTAGWTLIDLNRAGIALMEIVFEPDLNDSEEAAALIKELSLILNRIDTCDCLMEEGSLRVDANVSVHRPGEPLGVRREVKNLNSIRSVAKAVESEIDQQIRVLESGGTIINETRAYNADYQQTVSMRDKEVQQDYRYMPEPNLPPLRLCDYPSAARDVNGLVNITAVLKKLPPELPDQSRKNLVEKYEIKLETAITLVDDDKLHAYYLEMMEAPGRNGRRAANLLLNIVLAYIYEGNISIEDCPIRPAVLGEMVDLLHTGVITQATVEKLLKLLFAGDSRSPIEIVEENNWKQIEDQSEIEMACDEVIKQNPKSVKLYKEGKSKALNTLLGQIRKMTDNRADMALASRIVKERLAK